VHVRIVKVWRWTKSNRRFLLQSHLAATAEASEGLKVQAQTRFEEEDAAAALEFTDALSTSPTSIFHEQEFGDITVPDVDLVPISGSNSWIPIVLGAAAGLAGRQNFASKCILSIIFISFAVKIFFLGCKINTMYVYHCSVHRCCSSILEEAIFIISPCTHSRGRRVAERFWD